MLLSSWFPSFKSTAEEKRLCADIEEEVHQPAATPASHSDLMDFDAIADKVEGLQRDLAYANHLCEQANLQFDKYRIDVHELKQSRETQRAFNEVLQHALARERVKSAALEAQLQTCLQEVRRHKVVAAQWQARLNTETASLNAMTKHAHALEQRMTDLQLDVEYLKCTTTTAPTTTGDDPELERAPTAPPDCDAPLPAQPFVVVLVDGDFYQWTRDLFHADTTHQSGHNRFDPGGLAATRIRNEVLKYILGQDGKIPVSSKVVTRVFCNFGELSENRRLYRPRALERTVGLRDFAVQFTERIPLFDFYDSGRGKERADDKIRENFHLYLSTPNCHAVFVAACGDNGFARMLEQYSDQPRPYEKIVLVTPGYVVPDIQKLGFRQVAWPSVFATLNMPKNLAHRAEKDEQLRKLQVSRLVADHGWSACRVRGCDDGEDASNHKRSPDYSRVLLDLLPQWDMDDALGRCSGGLGVRGRRLSSPRAEAQDSVAVVAPTADDDDVD